MGALVAGHNSFSFSHDGERLRARFEGPRHPLLDHPGLPTDSGGIMSPRGTAMIGAQWTTVGFFHNGIDTMELYADGALIAQRTDLLSNISVVGPQGITIGNHPTVGVFLGGEFDEVKIWRLDPSIMDRQFFERIVDPSVADCWQRFFRSLAKALRDHPDCAARIHQLLAAMVYGNRQAIAATSPEIRQRYIQTCDRYLELWRTNLLDGPNMNVLLTDWRAAL
ncbi:MAG: hypothetical protein J0626_01860, partial [Rhodospirillaceae bacterium]|nr:hypothetical protein [Rhodospirillaceae bacterium]